MFALFSTKKSLLTVLSAIVGFCWAVVGALVFFAGSQRNQISYDLQNHDLDISSTVRNQKFFGFFDNDILRNFKKVQIFERKTSCQYIFGGILGSGGITGFGSVLNNALNAYLIASEVNVTFQLFLRTWPYTNLNVFFEDFAAETPCPVFDANMSATDYPNTIFNFHLTMENATSSLIIKSDVTGVYYFSDAFFSVCRAITSLQEREGIKSVFERKSLFTKALWNPVPNLKAMLQKLWLNVSDADGGYIGVHIRRGDKVDTKEMENIPVKVYYEKLLEFCRSTNRSCPKTVFVMTDDNNAFNEFSAEAKPSFTVVNLSKLVRNAGLSSELLLISDLKWLKPDFWLTYKIFWDTDTWDLHTRELIISITLLSMADYVVCTYSSNLCRLVAMLKGDSTFGSILSLDEKWTAL